MSLYRDQDDSDLWRTFWKNEYQNGVKKVSDPRWRWKKIPVSEAMRDPGFRKKIQLEFHHWMKRRGEGYQIPPNVRVEVSQEGVVRAGPKGYAVSNSLKNRVASSYLKKISMSEQEEEFEEEGVNSILRNEISQSKVLKAFINRIPKPFGYQDLSDGDLGYYWSLDFPEGYTAFVTLKFSLPNPTRDWTKVIKTFLKEDFQLKGKYRDFGVFEEKLGEEMEFHSSPLKIQYDEEQLSEYPSVDVKWGIRDLSVKNDVNRLGNGEYSVILNIKCWMEPKGWKFDYESPSKMRRV